MEQYWELKSSKILPDNLKIINEYLLHIRLSGRSNHTIKVYHNILNKYFEQCKLLIENIESVDVLSWLLNQSNKKPATQLLYFTVLFVFFNFCKEEGYTTKLIVKKRWKPQVSKPLPKYLEKSEVAKLRIYVETLQLRERMIVEFFLSSGCRVGELCSLQVDNINLEDKSALIKGKGGKIRQVHFSFTCALLLGEYLKNHHKKYLLIGSDGGMMTTRNVQYIIERIGKKAGLSKKLTPHCLRHTFATELLGRGAEIEFISEEMGHKNASTTNVYARIPSADLVALYRKYMG